jgi:hypothetical protein
MNPGGRFIDKVQRTEGGRKVRLPCMNRGPQQTLLDGKYGKRSKIPPLRTHRGRYKGAADVD